MLDFNDAPTSNTRKASGDGTDANREKSEIRTALNDQLSFLFVDQHFEVGQNGVFVFFG